MNRARTPMRTLVLIALVVVVLGAVGAIAGLASAVLRGPTWTSGAQLLWDPSVRAPIDPTYAQPDSQAFDRQVADQQDVVLSDAVVGRVARAVDQPASTVRDEVTVTSTEGSAVFTIDGTGATAAQARSVAGATTAAYIAVLQAQNEAFLQARVTALTAQAAELRRQLSSATAAAQTPLAASITDLQVQLSSARAALQDVPVEATVQRAAATPTAPTSLSVPVQTLVGAALGVILAICLLLLLNLLAPVLRGTAADRVLGRAPAAARPAEPRQGLEPALRHPASEETTPVAPVPDARRAPVVAASAAADTATSTTAAVPAETDDHDGDDERDGDDQHDRQGTLSTGSMPYFS